MKINLKNGEAISFTKKFPMSIFEIRDTLDRLKIPDDKPIVEFSISEYDNMELPYTLCRRVFSADIYKLNLFAERLENLKYDEMTAFKSLLIANPESGFENMLKMTYGLDSVMIYPCKDCCELGETVIENEMIALYDLGKLYSMEKSGLKNDEKSFKFYKKALQGLIQIEPKAKKIKSYLQYQIGMMYFNGLGTSIDNTKTVEYFEKSADKNMWASYQLGKLYLFGTDDIQKNKEKAMQYLNLSAEQGNEYAQNILNNQEKFENEMLASTIFSLFVNLSKCIEDDYHNKFQSGRKMIDSKLRRMIQEKNQALGIKHEHGQTQEY